MNVLCSQDHREKCRNLQHRHSGRHRGLDYWRLTPLLLYMSVLMEFNSEPMLLLELEGKVIISS